MPLVKSWKSISVTLDIMKRPTMISAGAVAAAGTKPAKGAKKRAPKKSTPVVKAVSPVLPPAATPEPLST